MYFLTEIIIHFYSLFRRHSSCIGKLNVIGCRIHKYCLIYYWTLHIYVITYVWAYLFMSVERDGHLVLIFGCILIRELLAETSQCTYQQSTWSSSSRKKLTFKHLILLSRLLSVINRRKYKIQTFIQTFIRYIFVLIAFN